MQAGQAPPLSEFKTVATAIRASEIKVAPKSSGLSGYLGVAVKADRTGLTIVEVEPDSPAFKAGLKSGDLLETVGVARPRSSDDLRNSLAGLSPGESVKIRYTRNRKARDVMATLGAVTRPRSLNEEKAFLGLQLGDTTEAGTAIRRVSPDSPAAKAGLLASDLVLKVDGSVLADAARLDSILSEKSPGDAVTLVVKREDKETEVKATLAVDPAAANRNQDPNQVFVPRNTWKKDVFRLAIIPIEYPDVKHNEAIKLTDWQEELFSTDTYKDKQSATGEPVHGSMNDFFRELSNGAFRVEGKVFEWVLADKNRMDYAPGNGTGIPQTQRLTLLTEALGKIVKRDGDKALENYDGVFFIYAGRRANTSRGSLYWPHRSSVQFQGKRLPYFIVQEGGTRMTDISVMCHEFGHMLGLPDLYARPENPGSEGLGVWCLMSNQTGGGRPQHMGAWCKEQLGWLKPTVIDPRVPQKLILSPVKGSSTECFKVLVRPDGSEYLLLENRRKAGFDGALPAEGLLIWHIVGSRPILEESHGVDGPSGPRSFVSMVPYPSEANTAYTPFTKPSSKSQLGGGLPVYITNIRQLPDGRVTFYIGYEFD
ncbi:MAG: M6 family metalloprotease domain-containing protein [Armatimonadetes bacterium]|nr:M6 family metalloprotease domain-containing protein [Armatimonadota bacterium]